MRARTPIAVAVLAGALYVGARPAGPLPALGPFLDPARGLWSAARGATDLPNGAEVVVPGLGARVRVIYDTRAVPHIFADREEDAYRALGYVVARDRLFQMFVQTLAEKLLPFGLGRPVESFDGPAIRQIVRETRDDNNRISRLILSIVQSTPFQMRMPR